MIQTNELSELLDTVTVRDAQSITAASSHYSAKCASLGFRVAVFHDLTSRRFMVDDTGKPINETIFGWDNPSERWWDEPQVGLKSPVALAARYESLPFWSNVDGARSIIANSHLKKVEFRSFFDSIVDFRSMIVVPIHMPFAKIGLACLFPNDKAVSDLSKELQRFGHILIAITQRIIGSYNMLVDEHRWFPENCKLTRRQAQCLHWASLGKTDAETSDILSISHAAVRYHIQSAIDRLDCVNRTQAVFRAGQFGYIGAVH